MKKFIISLMLGGVLLALPFEGLTAEYENLDSLSKAANGSWKSFSSLNSPEKLFLHIDRTYYAIGETIWFTGYLTNALHCGGNELSNFMYVELINGKGECVQREKVKAQGAEGMNVEEFKIFPGQLEIPNDLESGNYTVRAYTRWQLNGKSDYLFTQKIRVKGEKALKDYNVEAGNLCVDFYPESGRYFAGEKSVIGFKATDAHGRNVEISGRLVCERGAEGIGATITVTDVRTSHDGMGIINFTPEVGCRYFLEVQGNASESSALAGRFELSRPATEGVAIRVNNLSNAVYVSLQAKGLSSDCCLYLRSQSGIRALKVFKAFATSPIVIPTKQLESGVNHLIATDRGGKVLADRLFFLYRQVADEMKGSFSTEKQQYGRRERIRSNFSLMDAQDKPLTGQFSISVVRGAFAGFEQERDIVSYMAIESELEGSIHNPHYYFNEAVPIAERRANLDLLMMVQGWHYYDIEKIIWNGSVESGEMIHAGSSETAKNKLYRPKYGRELTQSISGRVASGFTRTKNMRYDLNVLIPAANIAKSVNIKGDNTFFVDSLDFQRNSGVVVSSVKSGGSGVFKPAWNGDVFAPVLKIDDMGAGGVCGNGFDGSMAREKGVEKALHNFGFDAANLQEQLENDFIMDSLVQVVVVARRESELFAQRDPMLEYKFEGEKDFWYNKPVIDFILAMYPEFHYDYGSMKMYTGRIPVRLAINGSIQESWGLLSNVMAQDVEVHYASASGQVMLDKSSGIRENQRIGSGKILSVTLLHGAPVENDPSTIYFMPLGYQEPQKFYSPRYDLGGDLQAKESDGSADRRNTIYWSPMVKMGQGGARINFCNSDLVDWPYVIHIEGVTDSGVPFSWRGLLEGGQ